VHDFQIANIIRAFSPDYELDFVPYASQVYFETWKVNSFHDEAFVGSEYKIKVIYNGKGLEFGECSKFTEAGVCDSENFMKHMEKQLYIGDE